MLSAEKEGKLRQASESGDVAKVESLIEAGVNVGCKDWTGNTPLHCAAHNGHANVTTTLIKAGADHRARDNRGQTPLHFAAYNDHANVTTTLIEAGAECNAKDDDGDTPLHDAAYNGHDACATLLLEAGADRNAKNNNGKTPADNARGNKKHDTARLIDSFDVAAAQRKCAAEAQAKRAADDKARRDAEARAKRDADEERARRDAEARAKRDAEEKAKLDAELKQAKLEAEQAKLAAEQAKRDAEQLKLELAAEQQARHAEKRSTQFHLSSVDIKIKAALGAGNFGEVFAAKWNGVPVAVKKLSKKRDDENSQAAESELLSEAGSLGVLRHPFVLGFFGVSRDPHTQQLMVVTELADGGSVESLLQDRLDRGDGCLPLAVALRLLRTAASGVEYIHSRGLAHRDLAARNVFLRRALDGGLDALIGDLGLACAANYYGRSESGESANKVSTKKLPLMWMSPESAMRSKFNGASDVWMFGVFAWELFGGCAAAPYTNLVLGLDVAETKARLRQRVFTPPFAYSLADERPVYCAPTRTDATATAVDDDTLRYDGRAVRADEYPPPPTWAALCSCWRGAAATRPTMRELRRTLKRHAREPWTPSSSAADTATVVTAPATTVATTPATTVATTVATANLVYAVQRGDGNVEANTEKKKEKEKETTIHRVDYVDNQASD